MERDKLVINNQYLVKLEDDDTVPLVLCTLLALHGDFAVVKPDGGQSTQWVPVERIVRETVTNMPEPAPVDVPDDVKPSEPAPAAVPEAASPFEPLAATTTAETEPDTMWRTGHLGWTACVGGEVRKVLGIDTVKGEALIAMPYGSTTVPLAYLI